MIIEAHATVNDISVLNTRFLSLHGNIESDSPIGLSDHGFKCSVSTSHPFLILMRMKIHGTGGGSKVFSLSDGSRGEPTCFLPPSYRPSP